MDYLFGGFLVLSIATIGIGLVVAICSALSSRGPSGPKNISGKIRLANERGEPVVLTFKKGKLKRVTGRIPRRKKKKAE